jgi:C4-dicarboxylate-specific signal transduction histidine kinase
MPSGSARHVSLLSVWAVWLISFGILVDTAPAVVGITASVPPIAAGVVYGAKGGLFNALMAPLVHILLLGALNPAVMDEPGFELETAVGHSASLVLSLFAGVMTDVRRRMQTQASELSSTNHRLDSILRSMGDGLAVTDASGRIRYVNPAFSAMAKSSEDALVETELSDVLGEDRLVDSNGGGHPVNVTRSSLDDGDQVVVVRDVRLLHEHQELVSTLKELREAQAQLIQTGKLVSLGQMAGAVAHELNNPLMAITITAGTLSEVVKEPHEAEDVDVLVDRIQRAAGRAAGVVSGVLTFARDSEATMESVDLADVVRQTLDLTQHSVTIRDVVIETQLGSAVVQGNSNQLQQVVTNLIQNAGYAAKTRVRVQCGREGGLGVVTVCDDGAGVSAEKMDSIFDPFYTTKPLGMGTGLGLSVSWGIVQGHGGRIEVDASDMGGARFRVVLPCETTD